ncbi:MAG: transposase DNA-binding-containing protein [Polaromonas sp.]|nr:transposase DNA-binding-containing protein [Polaromonas sp.]
MKERDGLGSTECETIDLGDERSKKRAILLAKSLSAQPVASVPQDWGWAKKCNQFVELGLMLGFDFPQKLQKAT